MNASRSILRMLAVARKSLVENLRDPVLLILLLAIPAFFMLITYVGYGHTPRTATYPVMVLTGTDRADDLMETLRVQEYEDGRPCFSIIHTANRAEAESALKEKTAAALLVIDEGQDGRLHYTVRGDALSMAFIKASVQLEAVVLPWLERQQGKPERFTLAAEPMERPRPISEFDAYVPGMMVFAILLIIPQTAMLIGRERRRGTLNRLDLSLLRPAEWLGGLSLSQMAVAVLQVGLMFAAALALGFQNRGSLPAAMVIGAVLAFGSVGIGLLLGCFMKTDTDALNTGSAVSMLQVFFSGSFFAMPMPALFTLWDHPITAFDAIPATHGMIALQQILSGGATLEQVWFRAAAAAVLSLVYFWIGVSVYRRASSAR